MDQSYAILQPALAMAALTFVVFIAMFIRRSSFFIKEKVDIQGLADPKFVQAKIPAEVNYPSDNFKNLFELPVIFYAVCGYLALIKNTDPLFLYLAWGFVAFRALHSLIHCTVNIVILRFYAYLLSSVLLWAMVGKLIFGTFLK